MATTDIKLIPLRCPDCGIDIESGEDDIVHFCSNCGSGFEVTRDKFKKVDIIFVKPKEEFANNKLYYLPMWQILSKISISKKPNIDINQIPPEILSNDRFTSFLAGLLKKEKPIDKMLFFVPAFGVTNRYQLMDQPGYLFTVKPPKLESDSPKDMVGAEYSLEDAVELAKVMFLSIQYHTDKGLMGLQGADIIFYYEKARIAAIPFYEEGAMLVDGLKGHKIFKNALKDWEKIKAKLEKN
ncbi:hypothetical protein JW879_01010 [candidate division WOR-3 bacterium]|nr:hypothetical protein [candidate division WOR-3 bacterium]